MRLLKEVDAEGISYRAKRKLKRRVYVNKVKASHEFLKITHSILICRGLTISGTLMGTTNLSLLVSPYMDVLMGKT